LHDLRGSRRLVGLSAGEESYAHEDNQKQATHAVCSVVFSSGEFVNWFVDLPDLTGRFVVIVP
jgi:hypothetical protein